MQIEGTTVGEASERQVHGRRPRKAGYGVAAAIVALTLIGGAALQHRGAPSSAAPAPPVVTYEQIRFSEENSNFSVGWPSAYMEDVTPPLGHDR